ncbi:MAG: hypothetical protein L3K07_09500, partial [Thermoplasmata archaeon]|nr:hypothetical protein [Thermoplasmata archaeon]
FAAGVVIGFTVYVLVLILSGELAKADVELLGRGLGLPRWLIRPIQRLCWRVAWPDLPAAPAGKAIGLQDPEAAAQGELPKGPPDPPPRP